ncbi:uncharacterized protein CC84DRAFT_1162497 [Paraphaeosphaeria sporulosa]|uniref:F-box domain-containing protein n=1 Tax=Paraphaeosphaeria sporulosa TaxID=1460663 RepID=A0A177CNS1_9PLEO|nr:uncharacterized protein CC84DRAFT_1162497 [Paraphaeosphaeria sporulosa]OAG08568.1 hypothetical protein CC84DRAFT_1162497 [Paraphaeosphaeria sporulosa]
MNTSDNWSARNWQDPRIDTKNQRIAALLVPPGPLGPFHPAHRYVPHPAETPLQSTTPLLRFPTELHLEIFGHIRADGDTFEDTRLMSESRAKQVFGDPHAWLWTVLALRGTSRLFRYMLPPLTHDELLDLELTLRATSRGLQACRYCLCLRHTSHFSHAQTRQRGVPIDAVLGWAGYSVKSREKRAKRFCVDCGFAKAINPELDIGKVRYGKGSDVVVGESEGERWVWCWWCEKLKRGKEAGMLGKEACTGSCVSCCEKRACKGACVREEQDRRRTAAEEWIIERRELELD